MLARSGGDPLADKRRLQGVPTFAEAARRVLEQKRGRWRGRWHVHNWWRSMERYVVPLVGDRPVSEVNAADVLEILSPLWHVRAATAREVRQRIRAVLWATPNSSRAASGRGMGSASGFLFGLTSSKLSSEQLIGERP